MQEIVLWGIALAIILSIVEHYTKKIRARMWRQLPKHKKNDYYL